MQSPWAPFHVDAGFAADQNVVTVLRAESAINVTGGLEEVASVMGSAASAFSWLHGGIVTVAISPRPQRHWTATVSRRPKRGFGSTRTAGFE